MRTLGGFAVWERAYATPVGYAVHAIDGWGAAGAPAHDTFHGRRGRAVKERLRVKPILLGFLVSKFGGAISGFAILMYSVGGDFMKMQTAAAEMSTMTNVALMCSGAFFALLAGFVAARLSAHSPGRHVRLLAYIFVGLGVLGFVIGLVTVGFVTKTMLGLVSTASTYGAVLLGGYLASDDEAEEATDENGE